ncbi:MAG TPA: carbohydrate ABC transporter permease [Firmicutes bacterium]|nr:carbohydrate ABC transporter permease [Bacillota bacterium]
MTITRRKHRINKAKIRKLMVGNGEREGLLMRIVTYILLIAISFVFLYPILKMLSRSLMGPYDSANPLVDWIPTSLYLSNFSRAYQVLGGYKTILVSIGVMLLIAVVETLSSAVIAYGFAKFEFRGRMILFVLMLSTFLIPSQITFLPNYVMFNKYGMLQSIFPILIPSIFGQGIRQALFILIFYQFYRMSPPSLDEAASIDGAGPLKIFWKINFCMATPALVVVLIFAFVWNWNETNLTSSYFGNEITTLPVALDNFVTRYSMLFPSNNQGTNVSNLETQLSEGIQMAGTLISILPLMLLYVLVERKLVESIDRSGITGE